MNFEMINERSFHQKNKKYIYIIKKKIKHFKFEYINLFLHFNKLYNIYLD